MLKIIKVPVSGEFHFVPKRKRNPVLAAVDWSIDVEVPSFDDSEIPTVFVSEVSELTRRFDGVGEAEFRYHDGRIYRKDPGEPEQNYKSDFIELVRRDMLSEAYRLYSSRRNDYYAYTFELEDLLENDELSGRFSRDLLDCEVANKSQMMLEAASNYILIGGGIYKKSGTPLIRSYVDYRSFNNTCGIEFCVTDANDDKWEFEDVYPASMYFNISDMESANAWIDSMTSDGEEFNRTKDTVISGCSEAFHSELIDLSEVLRVSKRVFSSEKNIERQSDAYINAWMRCRSILESDDDVNRIEEVLDNLIEMENIKASQASDDFNITPARSMNLMILEAARDRWRSRSINIDLNSSTVPSP